MTAESVPRRRTRGRSPRQIEESAQNKAAIVRMASTVFAERGYSQTTLDAVASRVGLTRPGILYHFASKEALFLAVLEQEREWAQRQVSVEVPPQGMDGVRELAALLGHAAQSRIPLQLVHVLEGEGIAGNEAASNYVRQRSDMVRDEIMRRLERAREEGELGPDADLAVLATLVAAAVNGLQKQWLINADVDTLAPFELLVDLIAAPHGARRRGRA